MEGPRLFGFLLIELPSSPIRKNNEEALLAAPLTVRAWHLREHRLLSALVLAEVEDLLCLRCLDEDSKRLALASRPLLCQVSTLMSAASGLLAYVD